MDKSEDKINVETIIESLQDLPIQIVNDIIGELAKRVIKGSNEIILEQCLNHLTNDEANKKNNLVQCLEHCIEEKNEIIFEKVLALLDLNDDAEVDEILLKLHEKMNRDKSYGHEMMNDFIHALPSEQVTPEWYEQKATLLADKNTGKKEEIKTELLNPPLSQTASVPLKEVRQKDAIDRLLTNIVKDEASLSKFDKDTIEKMNENGCKYLAQEISRMKLDQKTIEKLLDKAKNDNFQMIVNACVERAIIDDNFSLFYTLTNHLGQDNIDTSILISNLKYAVRSNFILTNILVITGINYDETNHTAPINYKSITSSKTGIDVNEIIQQLIGNMDEETKNVIAAILLRAMGKPIDIVQMRDRIQSQLFQARLWKNEIPKHRQQDFENALNEIEKRCNDEFEVKELNATEVNSSDFTNKYNRINHEVCKKYNLPGEIQAKMVMNDDLVRRKPIPVIKNKPEKQTKVNKILSKERLLSENKESTKTLIKELCTKAIKEKNKRDLELILNKLNTPLGLTFKTHTELLDADSHNIADTIFNLAYESEDKGCLQVYLKFENNRQKKDWNNWINAKAEAIYKAEDDQRKVAHSDKEADKRKADIAVELLQIAHGTAPAVLMPLTPPAPV